MTARPPLVLASASPRRADILRTLGVTFDVRPSGADESTVTASDSADFVQAVASLKLQHALDALDEKGVFVLAADTTVCVGRERLGQPIDDADALRMLELLTGREHRVLTGLVLGRSGRGQLARQVVETSVWFRHLDRGTLRRYVATGEGVDKAGAYAVQGLAGGFVTRLEGSYTNVVGLPAAEVVAMLLEHGALDRWP